MGNGIANGGFRRLQKGQKRLTLESFEKKYAKELAAAAPHQKGEVYQRIWDEYNRQKNHKPSAASLW
ncbi:MAG TPA: hypothetical protein VMH87_19645 [Pseudomonadales bacterium]|nr:hypothetical protein [Pseudomonadales bacterium]